MKQSNSFIAILLILLICLALFTACKESVSVPAQDLKQSDTSNEPLASEDSDDHVMATVTKVVDGDTVWVKYADHPDGIKLRYIGIDCPESVHDDESKNTKEGKLASDYNKELIEKANNIVYLEFDEDLYDQYDRLLAYVFVYDFDTEQYILIEDLLLQKGYCKAVKYEPNTKYFAHFKDLEAVAKESGAGFFGTGFY